MRLGEHINYSFNYYRRLDTARDFFFDILVCKKENMVNNRDYLFDPKFTNFGVGIAPHETFGTCVVVNYSDNLKPFDKKDGVLKIDFEEGLYAEVQDSRAGLLKKAKKHAKPMIKREAKRKLMQKAAGHHGHGGMMGGPVMAPGYGHPHRSKKVGLLSRVLRSCTGHKTRARGQPHVVVIT